jgi:hypothetical protein
MKLRSLACCVGFVSSGCFFSLEEPPARKAALGETTLIETNATWRFLDTGSAPNGWNTSAFDDSSWQEGDAELGYGDGDESQIVSYGPDENSKYVTFYCRRHFVVDAAPAYSTLTASVIRDDGVILYLNGQELLRDNMPAGAVSANTLSLEPIFDAAEPTPVVMDVSASALVAGENVLAAEIHQDDPTSSDTSFSLLLTAR